MFQILRYIWASPNTLAGLLVVAVAICSGGQAQIRAGVIECHGGLVGRFLCLSFINAAAMNLGHVIVARDLRYLNACRKHELAHVKQAEQWGPLFGITYVMCGIVAALRGRRFFQDNWLEQQALKSGGEVDLRFHYQSERRAPRA
jgi:hypothetical protein